MLKVGVIADVVPVQAYHLSGNERYGKRFPIAGQYLKQEKILSLRFVKKKTDTFFVSNNRIH